MANEESSVPKNISSGVIECPQCGKNTLEYSRSTAKIEYICVNPTCDYKAVKQLEQATESSDSMGVLLVVVVCALIVLAVAGAAGVA